jgi:hypothetical protein
MPAAFRSLNLTRMSAARRALRHFSEQYSSCVPFVPGCLNGTGLPQVEHSTFFGGSRLAKLKQAREQKKAFLRAEVKTFAQYWHFTSRTGPEPVLYRKAQSSEQ